MNHIHRLQTELAEANADMIGKAERLEQFRAHLHSPKFAAEQRDGSRGDWIAVADVLRWLRYIEG
jgi:hypothetical protein